MIPTKEFPRTLVFFALTSTLLAFWLMGSSTPRAQSAPAVGPIQTAINAASDGATVTITPGTYIESLTIDKDLTLTSVISSATIIQAVTGQRVITVTSGHNLRIENLTVTGGQAGANGGGGIYLANGNLEVVNSRIANNSASYGGGIYSPGTGMRVDATGSILELNHSSNHGGALYATGSVALTNTRVLSNTASGHGGGAMIWEGRADLLGGVFRNNTAGMDGGGLNINNSISVTGTQFISNTAGQNGGGLHQWNSPASVNITSARFEQNTATAKGGGLRANGTTTISGTLFLSNTVTAAAADVYGGGAYIANSLLVKASTFTGNVALRTSSGYDYGGALSIEGSATPAVIEDSLFEKGSAWMGAGVYRDKSGNGSVTVRRSTFSDNTGGYGGGLHTPDAQVENSSFLRNYVRDRGGALQVLTAALTSTRFISNSVGSGRSGGGIAVLGGLSSSFKGTNLLFVENQGMDAAGTADIFFFGGVSGSLRHVTIAHPSMNPSPAIQMGSMGTLTIRNSIIVSHTVGINQTNGTVDVDNTLFFGGESIQSSGASLITGTRILTGQNPRFVNPATGDYHLKPTSAAVDYGADLGVTTDLDGAPRPVGANPDLGAFEVQPLPYIPPDVYLPFLRKN